MNINSLIRIFTSSLGKKYIMAITGFGLVGFIIVHMLGNLLIFQEKDAINGYAHFLKSSEGVLWFFRIGLLAMVVLHIASAVSLARENRKARPVQYVKKNHVASYAARTMVWSGFIVFAFIVYHLAHFTIQVTHPEYQDWTSQLNGESVPDVYRMVIAGFSNPWVSIFYIIAVGLLAWHMSHGISSMFQSLGFRTRNTASLYNIIARGVSVIIFLGMAAVPAAVLLKIVS